MKIHGNYTSVFNKNAVKKAHTTELLH